jgi:hypothetical protein
MFSSFCANDSGIYKVVSLPDATAIRTQVLRTLELHFVLCWKLTKFGFPMQPFEL